MDQQCCEEIDTSKDSRAMLEEASVSLTQCYCCRLPSPDVAGAAVLAASSCPAWPADSHPSPSAIPAVHVAVCYSQACIQLLYDRVCSVHHVQDTVLIEQGVH